MQAARFLSGDVVYPLATMCTYSPSYNFTVNGKDLLRSVLASRGVTYTEPEPKRQKENPTPEELEKRQLRREKNKVAAAKCRNKRKAQSAYVHDRHTELEKTNTELRYQLDTLHQEIRDLEEMLKRHPCILSDTQRAALEREIESDFDEGFQVETIADSSSGSAVATPTSFNTSSGDEEEYE